MPRASLRKVTGALLALLVVVTSITPPVRALLTMPEHVNIASDTKYQLGPRLPLLSLRCRSSSLVSVSSQESFWILPNQDGIGEVEVMLLGALPLKKVRVSVIPRLRLIPGGHSIGVLLRSDGVIVTGVSGVVGQSGETTYPARDAGIRQGDLILAVDGQAVRSEAHIASLVNDAGRSGRPIQITAKRMDGSVYVSNVVPRYCVETRRYRIGLWVRDGAAGVGTLTFVDPRSMRFGALGHVVTDTDTGRPVEVGDGEIVKAQVTAIEEGRSGKPGEKIGLFLQDKEVLGSIDANSRFGISGTLYSILHNPLYPDPIEIALGSEVHPGPAEIVTVIQGQQIEKFAVEIIKVNLSPSVEGRNLVLRVTDPRLIKKTGGIVQGMSGSPIIQDGKLVGAVTHVFISDPTKGYGVLIENMVLDCGLVEPGWTGLTFFV
ncbi:MAG: SpoIVB peptidase [Bacillota bacterium]